MMKKLLVFILLVLIAIVLAGLYGMIHNQISYTVSPEYFTKFKFRQFGFVDNASYLGGTLAILVACAFQLTVRIRTIG